MVLAPQRRVAARVEVGSDGKGWLARQDSNLEPPDPESGAIPLGHAPAMPSRAPMSLPRGTRPRRHGAGPCAWTLAQVSLSVSVRLKTGRSGVESGSGQK